MRLASFLSGEPITAIVFSKSTGKETGKMLVCAVLPYNNFCPNLLSFVFSQKALIEFQQIFLFWVSMNL